MQRTVRLGLAIVIAALALGAAGGVGAQSSGDDDFPSLTLGYRDRDGAGVAHIAALGADPASGGTSLAVTLEQNGRAFSGRGFARQVDRASFVAAFWLADGFGNDYVFTGVFVRGFAGWTAQGRYEPIDSPGGGDSWTMASAPCPIC